MHFSAIDPATLDAAITWRGAGSVDDKVTKLLPSSLRDLLVFCNGFVLFDGMLHVRGTCAEPLWHSLEHVWSGELALSGAYKSIQAADVPFAQDALGDQFFLRDGEVWQLSAETDTADRIADSLAAFISAILADPFEALNSGATREVLGGNKLLPGQLINVTPPFVLKSDTGYTFRAIPALEQVSYLMDFAQQIRDMPDGTDVTIRLDPKA